MHHITDSTSWGSGHREEHVKLSAMFQCRMQSSKCSAVDKPRLRETGVRLNVPPWLSSSFAQCDLQFHCDSLVQNKDITSYALNYAFSRPACTLQFLCWRIYSLRGVGRDRKTQKKEEGGGGGLGTDRGWGYGDGQLSSIPQGTGCYAKQNLSFFFFFPPKSMGANLSTLTNTLFLPTPWHPHPSLL